jgi:hypothetical protein
MKFDGTNWINVGSAGFSKGESDYISLAFSPTGQPYVAYEDYGNSQKATVMKFDGSNWVNVGNADFSKGSAQGTNLAFSPSGVPYVSFKDYEEQARVTVMKYDSTYSGINEKQESRLSIYPNPATDKITLETTGAVKESNLAIVNAQGQELISRKITEPKTQIDISNLPSGVYFVRLLNEKTVEVGKIIKQ